MNILALDPGPEQTGFAIMRGRELLKASVLPNDEVLDLLGKYHSGDATTLAIEMIASYGMAVGREVFETCVWIGRFQQAWCRPSEVRLIYRLQVKQFLCRSPSAKDANVRRAILDLFPRAGGGAVPQVGTKKRPGPLFGVSSHAWPALGVALTVNPEYNDAATRPDNQRLAPRRRAELLLPVGNIPVADRAGGGRAREDGPRARGCHGQEGRPRGRAR